MEGTTVLITMFFVLVVAALAAGIGRAVRHPGPGFDVEPRFARDAVTGLAVLWQVGLACSERMERYVEDMQGRELRGEPLAQA